jgi:hypothetical protein
VLGGGDVPLHLRGEVGPVLALGVGAVAVHESPQEGRNDPHLMNHGTSYVGVTCDVDTLETSTPCSYCT